MSGRAASARSVLLPRAMRLAWIAIVGTVVGGCSSWQLQSPGKVAAHPDATPPPGTGEVCVVRTSVLAQAVPFPTRDNGVLVGATKGPSHFCYFAGAGQHEISVEGDDVAFASLSVEAGKRYWLKHEVDFVFGFVSCRPVWVAEEIGRELASGTAYEVLVGVPGDEALPRDPMIVAGRRTVAAAPR